MIACDNRAYSQGGKSGARRNRSSKGRVRSRLGVGINVRSLKLRVFIYKDEFFYPIEKPLSAFLLPPSLMG
jgi:hypothetical protein